MTTLVMALSRQQMLHYSLLMRVLPCRPLQALQSLSHALTIPLAGMILMVRHTIVFGTKKETIVKSMVTTISGWSTQRIQLVVPVAEVPGLKFHLLPRLLSHRVQLQPQASFPLLNPQPSQLLLHPECALTIPWAGMILMVRYLIVLGTKKEIIALYSETTMKTLVKLQIRCAVFVAAEMTHHLRIPPFHLLLLRHQILLPS